MKKMFPNCFIVFGASTDVGKTWLSAGLANAAQRGSKRICYVKPMQTGVTNESEGDANSVTCAAANVRASTIYSWKMAASPHRAAAFEDITYDEQDLLSIVERTLIEAQKDCVVSLIETAGGAASPDPKLKPQAELLRCLSLPAILVGDPKLGGISTTVATYYYLRGLGFEVAHVVYIADELENADAVANILRRSVIRFSACRDFGSWVSVNSLQLGEFLSSLSADAQERAIQMEGAKSEARDVLWWPFTQHSDASVTFIDSAYGVNFETDQGTRLDASGSWWTNGVGHGSARLSHAVAAACGRYGHVLFPEHVHQPALDVAKRLLETAGKGWAGRVFYTDNGSAAVEVALKMAFRYRESHCGASKLWKVLGLRNSYHGDTKAAMDASSPNSFKKGESWYEPKGLWLDFPAIAYESGALLLRDGKGEVLNEFLTLEEVFGVERLSSNRFLSYQQIIEEQIIEEIEEIGALLLEPVLHGSAGMVFCDPLFQAAAIVVARKYGIPVIYDEIFVGLWRLGVASCQSLLFSIKPDIACYGKLLTGGVLPLAVTLASGEVFEAFLGNSRAQALLHGHSFTAHPIGCAAAAEALSMYAEVLPSLSGSVWNENAVRRLSTFPSVRAVRALGTVLAVEFNTQNASYFSDELSSLVHKASEYGIHFRQLGNVLYFVLPIRQARSLADRLLLRMAALCEEFTVGS